MSNLSGCATINPETKLLYQLAEALGSHETAEQYLKLVKIARFKVTTFEIMGSKDGPIMGVKFRNAEGNVLVSLKEGKVWYIRERGGTVSTYSKVSSNTEPSSARHQNIFRVVNLFSLILPPKVWSESFEPHFEDSKAAYLKARRTFKGKFERKWLAFSFLFQMSVAFFQSLFSMLGEKAKKAFWAAFGGVVIWLKGQF